MDENIPFGEALAGAVWDKLRRSKDGWGIAYGHPYYCGHGLVRKKADVALVIVEDGRAAKTLKAWSKKADFVDFWAPLTDFVCGGADPANALFYTADDWERNNQRMTRERLEEFVK